MTRFVVALIGAVTAVCFAAAGAPAFAQVNMLDQLDGRYRLLGQAQPAEPKPADKPADAKPEEKPEEKPKTFWEENVLFSYVENSVIWNMGRSGRDHTANQLRYYDNEDGYTFNMAEFSIKKDPSEKYPFGYGLVLTAGIDSQKNHALGIFRGNNDTYPFRNTEKFDLQEAYLSGQIPIGSGLIVKGGKFVTLLGYEVIESPNNLNFSRSFLYSFSIPFTHVGGLISYSFPWLTITAGPVVGWDVAKDNNSAPSALGQFAFTAVKDLTLNLNWITGPEQFHNNGNPRTVFDFVGTYTGIKNLTLGLNVDYGWEYNDPNLVPTRSKSNDPWWWGFAGYVAYDWFEPLRTALRVEYFQDTQGIRTLAASPGSRVALWEVTATVQYRVWKGLFTRLEYRHDNANQKVFATRAPGYVPTAKEQDTLSLDVYYLFF
jgi:Putative beta-barrel porin-2, OmpL-like. bbp2